MLPNVQVLIAKLRLQLYTSMWDSKILSEHGVSKLHEMALPRLITHKKTTLNRGAGWNMEWL